MSMIKLEEERFKRRSKEIRKHLGGPLVVLLGKGQDVLEFRINSALFIYLLGYEFPETILIVDDTCTAITSQKKSEILKQISCLNIVVRNKDNSNMDEIYGMLRNSYYVADSEEIQGDFCRNILEKISVSDATEKLGEIFLTKDDEEIKNSKASGMAVSALMKKGMEMLWDGAFEKARLEEMMNSNVDGVDMSLCEFSFPVEYTRDRVRIGVRYNGYCSEASRTIVTNMEEAYMAQEYILGLVREGTDSSTVYSEGEKYFAENGLVFDPDFIYTIGLMSKERSFKNSFILRKGCVFVIRLNNETMSLSNTFILEEVPEYLTLQDAAPDFLDKRSRFRDKTKEYELSMRRKEHQKELLDKLIEERLEFYRNLSDSGKDEEKKEDKIVPYGKESLVPRQGRLVVDFSRESIVVPIGSYAVPFHVSSIKSIAVTDEKILRINFKAEPKGRDGAEETEHEQGGESTQSTIKSISLRGNNSRELAEEINNLKKIHSTRKTAGEAESFEELKISQRPLSLTDVYMRTDIKTGSRRRKVGSLELHANGFRFKEENVVILFSNIRHIFFSEGNVETNAILHLHLLNPIILGGKVTNVQFYREAGSGMIYDTMKRGDEHMEYIIEKEEEDRQEAINQQFRSFVNIIESETDFKVQIPKTGFHGVPFRENVMIKQTHECLVSLDEAPYFVLTLEDVEVVNFERVVLTVKTVDVLFILKNKYPLDVVMKNKSRLLVSILSVDVQSVNKLKEYLDSNNILFMETSASIRWNNVIGSIMKDPISFYEDGAWSGLMVGDSEESSEDEELETSEESNSSETEDLSTDDEDVSDISSEDPSEDESDYDSSDDEDEEDDSEEEYDQEPGKRRKN
ncbi:nucleosome binding factor SPN subunit SPT16 [Encephalitozoon intestinalis ATCC 50506]|uniref:FACT complex subunit n=1 Tax=Encephalitozoon intestinalis (strain ATCC 50506) TaxID=876142 RepID=E0S643_ENCIT|nr:nucleosome binding factor SPN subunit SPT16 [Encephalitozoon intestinalis ATCC 50506]ADM11178.1 nucleosome binding factor SPN subunit SPT16 [Encephalitozoon intestinalis ATCC 50506]UTX44845.1 FACT complex subunit spt16 [Encephalitozoon intestinalis]